MAPARISGFEQAYSEKGELPTPQQKLDECVQRSSHLEGVPPFGRLYAN
jgi:hypothetical protein